MGWLYILERYVNICLKYTVIQAFNKKSGMWAISPSMRFIFSFNLYPLFDEL